MRIKRIEQGEPEVEITLAEALDEMTASYPPEQNARESIVSALNRGDEVVVNGVSYLGEDRETLETPVIAIAEWCDKLRREAAGETPYCVMACNRVATLWIRTVDGGAMAKCPECAWQSRVYYTGDMANSSGWFYTSKAGDGNLRLIEDGEENREFTVSENHIGTLYQGHCNPRFVTAEAHRAFYAKAITENGWMVNS